MTWKGFFVPLLIMACLEACRSGRQPQTGIVPATPKDTTKDNRTAVIKPYASVITSKAITRNGWIKTHQVNNRYFFEIPKSLLGKDLLSVNRIAEGGASYGYRAGNVGYAGDYVGENMVRFSHEINDKLFIRVVYQFQVSKDSTEEGLQRAMAKNSNMPIYEAFDIKAFSPDSSGIVIDVTDYLNSQNEIFSIGRYDFIYNYQIAMGVGAPIANRSYIRSVQPHAANLEIETVRTYARASGLFATYVIHSSLFPLPERPLRPRFHDERIGYFTQPYEDLDVNPHGVQLRKIITRWRLEPKPADRERYLRGELVEPQKPMVYYIDPATPRKWVPYLIQGVNDWQRAFEKAGFKNAIYARTAPNSAEDSTWNPEDSRFSVIVYKPSDLKNASGPHVHDPRTGEILETHINWYHNVMQLLQEWYMVQAGPLDPRARTMHFSDTLMGKLIRFVCAHEVGHTLGLKHNFGASYTVPVDSLRSKRWVEANGHTPSIMDYARFNYVAQPEDGIAEKGIFPRIGPYDEWAIEWGYRWFPAFNSQAEELDSLNRWVIKRLQDKRLHFGDEGTSSYDPRHQAEDLGDDAVKAGIYGIRNLQRIIPQLVAWTSEPTEGFKSLQQLYDAVCDQYKTYILRATTVVGGAMRTPKTAGQDGAVWSYPAAAQQRAAVQFITRQAFVTPTWLLNDSVFRLTQSGSVYRMMWLHKAIVEKLLSHQAMANLLWFQAIEPHDAYTPNQLLNDLEDGIWTEVKTKTLISFYRRNLQKIYVAQLVSMLGPYKGRNPNDASFEASNKLTDEVSVVKGHIRKLAAAIDAALPSYKDEVTRFHLQDMRDQLKQAVNPSYNPTPP